MQLLQEQRVLPQDLIFIFIFFSLRVSEASRGLIESSRAGGSGGEEGKNAKQEKEGFGESELKTTLQCSATSTVAAQRARSYSVHTILTIKSL